MEPFVGQIIPVGFNFAPVGWFLCQGQLVPIAQFETLFALIGTTYGGDGISSFGIPDLRGRAPLHQGQGTGLSFYALGQITGTESVTLTAGQVGAHSHAFMASTQTANTVTPGPTTTLGNATPTGGLFTYDAGTASNTNLTQASISSTGSSNPHENRQPYLGVNYIIAWAGIFPNRN
jgi:microcystin-dependent protein